jgi:ethanolamine ammonia-lyase small subunit
MNGLVPPDPWAALRRYTPARIALGRSGGSLPAAEVLRLSSALARARDAVHMPLDTTTLAAELATAGWPALQVASQAPTRPEYLRRPDLGRRLRPQDAQRLREAAAQQGRPVDLVLVLADGLSALAVQQHALPVLQPLHAALQHGTASDGLPPTFAPVVLAAQARVALADDVGAALQARLALILLGERPGLSAADSLGAYLTWNPQPGRTDGERNCVSNIRPEGLACVAAGQRLAWLVRQALRRRLSGVPLQDDRATQLLPR